MIIAAAFVSIVWGYFYGDDLGVIDYLRLIGLPGVRWLTDGGQAMTSIVIMDVWKNTGVLHDHVHRRAAVGAEIGLALMYLTSSFGVFLLPVLLLFLLAQKFVIEGITMCGIKN